MSGLERDETKIDEQAAQLAALKRRKALIDAVNAEIANPANLGAYWDSAPGLSDPQRAEQIKALDDLTAEVQE